MHLDYNMQAHPTTQTTALNTHRQRLDVEDEEVEGEGEDDCSQQPNIDPGRHPDQGLVLRQTSEFEQIKLTLRTYTEVILSCSIDQMMQSNKSPI